MGNAPAKPITINDFDPIKYQGEWWEIAKFPTVFQQGCLKSKACYEWDECKQQLNITNICFLSNGNTREIKGHARNTDKNNPGRLLVSFPSVSSNPSQYWIHWTDYERYAIIGNAARSQLFILARKECISSADLSLLKLAAKGLGYNLNRIVISKNAVGDCTNVFSENCDDQHVVDHDETDDIVESEHDTHNYYKIEHEYNLDDKHKGDREIKSDSYTESESRTIFWNSS